MLSHIFKALYNIPNLFIFMTMPLGWKNNATKITLVEYLIKNQKETFPEVIYAVVALTFYVGGEELVNGGAPPYTPTTYDRLTGKQYVAVQVKKTQEIMTLGRTAAYDADDLYKHIIDVAKKRTARADFALSYILFWKLYRIAPFLHDLPEYLEACLIHLRPTDPQDILKTSIAWLQTANNPVFSSMLNKIMLEYYELEAK
jgi:hypothetical protein